MPTKAELIAQLATYDERDKGWGRKNIYGDPGHIKHLRGVLALPHIQAMSDETIISLREELERLEIDYDRVFSIDFRIQSEGHASAKLYNAINPKEPPLKDTDYATDPSVIPISKRIQNTLELLRDQLIFYIVTVSSQPKFVLFNAEYLGSGGSGFTGLQRAQELLNLVKLAVSQYTRTGILSPLLSEIYTMNFGLHTRRLINSTIITFIDLIKEHLRIKTSFSSSSDTRALFEQKITANPSGYCLEIAGRKILIKPVTCHVTEELFLSFLEKYLIESKFSFTSPIQQYFSNHAFGEAFNKHLYKLKHSELSSHSSTVAVKDKL